MVKVLALRDDNTFAPIELDDLYLQVSGGPGPDPDPDPFPDSQYVPAGYVRTFSEEFGDDFKVLDASNAPAGTRWIGSWKAWNIRYLEDNNDKAMKIVGNDTHVLENGALSLRGLNRKSTAQSGGRLVTLPYTSGMISTEIGFTPHYGYFEILARIVTSKGHHAAIWLLHADGSYKKEVEVAEVDFVEAVNGEKKIYMNHHGPGVGPMTELHTDPTEWHTYGLLWEPGRMIWHLDGKEVRKSTKSMPRAAYMLASIEIGGKWPGMPDASTTWPSSIDLAYWRVYRAE